MSQVTIGYDVVMENGLVLPVRNISSSGTYTITDTSGPNSSHDHIISVSTTDAVTIELPTAASARTAGRINYIHAKVAGPSITIDGNGKNINGSSTKSLTGDYNSITVTYDGTDWFII